MKTRNLLWVVLLLGFISLSTYACSTFRGSGTELVEEPCEPGEICVTVTADETTGKELRLILYETTEDEWPTKFYSIPTPSWVVTKYPPVPEEFPVRIRIPLNANLSNIRLK